MNLVRSAVLALAIAATSCASTSSPAASEAELRQLATDFVQAVNDADADRFVSFFAPDASAFFPSPANRERVKGIESIRTIIGPALAQKPANPLVARDFEIDVDGNLGVVSFNVGSQQVSSRRTLVVRRIGGTWKVVHLHASNLRPPE
jgi:uncharacterized protein (TIGR02246 family)